MHTIPLLAAACAGASPCVPDFPAFHDWLRGFLEILIYVANWAGGLVIGVGTVRALLLYLLDLFRLRGRDIPKEGIRLSLGRSFALGLEFQLGADILATALDPSIRDISVLAAIVVLRTALNFFLQRELRDADTRDRALAAGS